MDAVAIPVLGLAVVDSINPSALVVALWWLSQPRAVPRLLAYVAGIAVAYLSLGVALMLGLGAAVRQFGDALDHPVVVSVQLALGLALLAYGIFAPKAASSPPEPPRPRIGGLLGMALLGMLVTTVELTTALPYFAAVALMTSAQMPVLQWLPLLLVYNAIFIAPPLLLLGLHLLAGRHFEGRFAQWRAALQRGAREALLWVIAIAGVALSGDAVTRFMGKRGDAADVVWRPSQHAAAEGKASRSRH